MNLLSIPTLVESPFIIAKIGNYTFGSYHKVYNEHRYGSTLKVTYPNFMKKIEMVKLNGQVNTYTITMEYQIRAGDDPNLLDKVFSSIANIGENSRQITLSYGDWASPSFIYKEETALITNIISQVDYSGSKITYTIKCISNALPLTAVFHDFPRRNAKPSDIIKEILYNNKYGLLDIFYGMSNNKLVDSSNLIASDDKVVTIDPQHHVNILSYLNYLVNCMVSASDGSTSAIRTYKYALTIVDDVSGKMGGPYFKITRVNSKINTINSLDTYEIDVGYPGDNFVTQFSINNDQSWALLYQYSQQVAQENYTYKIDKNGEFIKDVSPSIMMQPRAFKVQDTDKAWWTNMTQFPISATMTIKGLLRPSILMSYLNVNVYFYGQKHVSSGLYIITKQVDTIDDNGYKTVLSLQRVGVQEGLSVTSVQQTSVPGKVSNKTLEYK